MRCVEFHAVEPGLLGPHRSGDEVDDELLDFLRAHLTRTSIGVRARRHRLGADELGVGPTSSVVELDDGQAPVLLDARGETGEAG